MFTGLVRERGRLLTAPKPVEGGGAQLVVGHSAVLGERLSIGASLAVSGVCLTVVTLQSTQSRVDLAPETLKRTNLGQLGEGDEVNLEPALSAGEPLGGHWVQGHVDTVLEVAEVAQLGDHREVSFHLPGDYAGFVVEKGSVTLDGVSLTVARLEPERFTVALIPHTLEVTTLDAWQAGRRVNFEVDVLAKYVQRAAEVYGRRP